MSSIVLTSEEDLQRIINLTVETATAKVLADLPKADSIPKTWLTNKEAMNFLGLSKTTLQRLRKGGKLPYSKVGSNIFYSYKDVVKVLEDNMVK